MDLLGLLAPTGVEQLCLEEMSVHQVLQFSPYKCVKLLHNYFVVLSKVQFTLMYLLINWKVAADL